MEQKLPPPPFTFQTATQKVQMAEDAWNSRDPQRIALAYTIDTEWRNRDQFINGREQVIAFLTHKWERELNYKLKKELWAYTGNRIAVRFEYEYHDHTGQWYRAYGNENWEFNENGLMQKRYASINDLKIEEGGGGCRGLWCYLRPGLYAHTPAGIKRTAGILQSNAGE